MAMRCSLGIPWAVSLASVYRKGALISVPGLGPSRTHVFAPKWQTPPIAAGPRHSREAHIMAISRVFSGTVNLVNSFPYRVLASPSTISEHRHLVNAAHENQW